MSWKNLLGTKGMAPLRALTKLTMDNLNPRLIEAQYAVRGEMVIKADEFAARLAKGDTSLPFKKLIYCNIGNPMALGQQPITFFRQVLSLCVCPSLMQDEEIVRKFPRDVVARAKRIIGGLAGNNMGAYSASVGTPDLAADIASFIERRDGFPSDMSNILMSNGASDAISKILSLLIRSPKDGVLIPVPQYPLYSATISLYGGFQIPYHLKESEGWALDMDALVKSFNSAVDLGIVPRAIVIINPGNPTGQVLSEENLTDIIRFCHETGVMLLADEVYQDNIYGNRPFISAKKVLRQMGEPFTSSVQLSSFHSTSKGFIGECGFRGGYAEVINFDPLVKAQLWKLASIHLCCNMAGQIMMSLLVNPPREGEESYPLFKKERDMQLASLKRRAIKLAATFNRMEGVTCNEAEGAMYLFPNIRLPQKAVAKAQELNKQPDTYYCLQLLNQAGICLVPGSGFQQAAGTYHFRTTFLPPEEEIDEFSEKIVAFHNSFMREHRD